MICCLGLETYTLRSGYHTVREAQLVDDVTNTCPPNRDAPPTDPDQNNKNVEIYKETLVRVVCLKFRYPELTYSFTKYNFFR